MKKVLKNKKAFTLTEMIVVIAIIGILAGVLIPTITGYIKRANQSAAYQEAEAVLNIYETYQVEKEAGITDKSSFAGYYQDVCNETLSDDSVYLEYADDTHEELKNFVYVSNEIVVVIDLETNNVKYYDSVYLSNNTKVVELS